MFWYLFLGRLTCISLAYLLCDHLIGEPILKLSYRITVFMSQISNLASLLYDVKFSLETILLSTFSLEYTRVKSMIPSNLCQNLLDPNHGAFWPSPSSLLVAKFSFWCKVWCICQMSLAFSLIEHFILDGSSVCVLTVKTLFCSEVRQSPVIWKKVWLMLFKTYMMLFIMKRFLLIWGLSFVCSFSTLFSNFVPL
jgi:hypothetical protein